MDLNVRVGADDKMFDVMKLLQLLAMYGALPENVLVKLDDAPLCLLGLPHRAFAQQINWCKYKGLTRNHSIYYPNTLV
eukprot:1059694-Pyramimonas_sp.AAC.1